MKTLDETDFKLLDLLRQNARMPLKDLSAEVFLSTPAVSARIEKLENDGFIKGYHAATDYEKLGNGIKAFIMITVRPEDKPEFIEFMNSSECVLECNNITGNYSMIVKAMFPSTTPMNAFVGELQKFGKTQTQVVFETIVERY
ncbi:MAG: Lrp/AsnC family transcriptional regulator [Eubacteriaceae bacterium]|nr:Lrp/AsnC family transcriptional regulator [Eubacteriaceae bacterium]